jgi:hypothetical protein
MAPSQSSIPKTGPELKIYANPVRRRRVAKAEDWEWSSARWFAAIGPVPIAMHAMVREEFSREGPGQPARGAALRSERPPRIRGLDPDFLLVNLAGRGAREGSDIPEGHTAE